MKIPIRLLLVVYWIVFAAVTGYFFGWLGGGEELVLASRLRTGAPKADGRILSVRHGDALNSASVNYSYQVGGRQYFAFSNVVASRVATLGPGSPIEVRYLSDAPQQSGVDVQGMVDSGRRAIALAFVVELILAIVFLSSILLNGRVSLRPSASPSGGAGNPPVTLGNQIAGLIVVSIMFLAGAAMLLFSAYPTFVKANKLAQFSRATDAQITGVFDQPEENARQADYAFVVNGVNYSGSADYSGGYGDRGPLRIYYLPSDPNFSCVDPAAKAKNAKFGLIFVLVWELIIGGVLYGVTSQIRRLRR